MVEYCCVSMLSTPGISLHIIECEYPLLRLHHYHNQNHCRYFLLLLLLLLLLLVEYYAILWNDQELKVILHLLTVLTFSSSTSLSESDDSSSEDSYCRDGILSPLTSADAQPVKLEYFNDGSIELCYKNMQCSLYCNK